MTYGKVTAEDVGSFVGGVLGLLALGGILVAVPVIYFLGGLRASTLGDILFSISMATWYVIALVCLFATLSWGYIKLCSMIAFIVNKFRGYHD